MQIENMCNSFDFELLQYIIFYKIWPSGNGDEMIQKQCSNHSITLTCLKEVITLTVKKVKK